MSDHSITIRHELTIRYPAGVPASDLVLPRELDIENGIREEFVRQGLSRPADIDVREDPLR